MNVERAPSHASPEIVEDAAETDSSLRDVATVRPDDPSAPEVGYYVAELRSLRAALRVEIDGETGG